MKSASRLIAGVALAVVAAASAAEAQHRPLQVGVAAGTSTPSGNLSEVVNEGFHVQGMVAIRPALLPVSLRADLLLQQMPDAQTGNYRQVAGLLNAKAGIPLGVVSPYAIGGVGLYNGRFSDAPVVDLQGRAAHEHDTRFGYNLGGGFEIPLFGVTTFAEARVHTITHEGRSTRTVPISLGVMF